MSFREDGAAALEWAARYLERVGELPVLAQVEPGDIRRALPVSPPEQGEPFADVLRDLDEVLLPGITHWQSPRFFAYFAVSAAEPGILAELLAATLNSVAFLWRTSPASTELEEVTLDWVAQLLGLPRGWHGHIEDTASTSTIAALAAARETTGRNVVVCSEHSHSSVDKAAKLLGLELRKTPTEGDFRLRPDALDLTDAAAVVATVGTTSTASVDPVAAIADLCADAGVWLHVDAAYAGSAWVCPELRWSQAGVERADSLVVNAHKWQLRLRKRLDPAGTQVAHVSPLVSRWRRERAPQRTVNVFETPGLFPPRPPACIPMRMLPRWSGITWNDTRRRAFAGRSPSFFVAEPRFRRSSRAYSRLTVASPAFRSPILRTSTVRTERRPLLSGSRGRRTASVRRAGPTRVYSMPESGRISTFLTSRDPCTSTANVSWFSPDWTALYWR